MNQASDQKHCRAVICLFCGTHTPLPETRSSDDPRLSIIRCQQCGKEAPYPAGKIIDSQEIPSIGYLKIRAVDMG
jgi:RNase P subunit RPR2